MIIQIDSNFRNFHTYPYASEFDLTVNGTPPSPELLSFRDDLRCANLTSDFIRYAFRWVGNHTSMQKPPTPISFLPDDTYYVNILPISSRSFLVIPTTTDENELSIISSLEYFTGTSLWVESLSASATVAQYNNFQGIVESDIFQDFYPNCCLEDVENNNFKDKYIEGAFVNPSFHLNKNLLLLGAAKFVYEIQNSAVIKGLSVNLFIENVTKGWVTKIKKIDSNFRNVILDVPTSMEKNLAFESQDFYIVWKEARNEKYIATDPPFIDGVQRFEIVSSTTGFKVGQHVQTRQSATNNTIRSILMKIIKTDNDGRATELEIIHPGSDLKENTEYNLFRFQNRFVTIRVDKIGSGIITNSILNIRKDRRFLFAIVDTNNNNILYYTITERRAAITYLSIDLPNLIKIFEIFENNPYGKNLLYCYYIPYQIVFPNLVLNQIPFQNPVCARITLYSICIPNLNVCGYNIRLANFPYLLCSFGNAIISSISNQNSIASNIPAVTGSNFLIPIANVKNPFMNFLIVSTRQTAFVKFTPNDTLSFKLMLPDGSLLRFNTSDDAKPRFVKNSIDKYKSFDCSRLNLPLNSFEGDGSTLVYPYVMENGITATFGVEILK